MPSSSIRHKTVVKSAICVINYCVFKFISNLGIKFGIIEPQANQSNKKEK